MKTLLRWSLWLWISLCICGAFLYAPLAEGFVGQSSRILFFHVPMAWGAFVAFITAGVYAILYLKRRRPEDDRRSEAAVQIGLLFCVLATITGALWARVMWGAYWNWDPRQASIVIVLVFYAAYLVLRDAVEDPETEARLASVYAVLGLIVAPFFFFVLPRIVQFTLHPDSVINDRGSVDMESRMLQVLLAGAIGFTALFFWILRLQTRLAALEGRRRHRGLLS
ncbi:MAG: cytochrome c biogenesis protein CcsA [Thermoanaerobaculia bacterium]|nr:cytochrome c biogenesis protein CcsA [Thermoanaerobaculia bacterium]